MLADADLSSYSEVDLAFRLRTSIVTRARTLEPSNTKLPFFRMLGML